MKANGAAPADARLAAALAQVSEAIEITDRDGRIQWVNASWERVTGYTAAEAFGRTPKELLRSDFHPEAYYVEAWNTIVGGEVWSGLLVSRRKDGTLFPAEVSVSPILGEDGKVQALACVRRDITARLAADQALLESEERYKLAAMGAKDGLWDWRIDTGHLFVSDRWRSILGIDPGTEVTPDEWTSRIWGEDAARVAAEQAAHLAGQTDHFECEYRILHQDGGFRWVLCRGLAFGDDATGVRFAGSLTDIHDRKSAEARLFEAATHDHLTALPNRGLFLDRVGHAIGRVKRTAGSGFAVLFIDLRRFKQVNDGLGHHIGDGLLKAVARRLSDTLRPGDTVARLGGDEFGVLLERIGTESDADAAAARLERALSRPFDIDGHTVAIGGTVGAVVGGGSSTVDELIRDADAAMYEARKRGDSGHHVADDQIRARMSRRSRLAVDLALALERDGIRAVYQPIVELSSGRVVGVEALARWRHPELGEIGPAEFIGIAEESGMGNAIGRSMLDRVVEQLAAWHAARRLERGLFANVNVTARQLHDPRFVDHVMRLHQSGLAPAGRLGLEITETVVVDRPESVTDVMRKLRGIGVKFALDDFGTGYSSLSHLRGFPVQSLKIDRTFTWALTTDPVTSEIVRALIQLSRALGITTVAEGVETVQQFRILRDLGCELGQGYLFARPQERDAVRFDPIAVEALGG